MRGLKTVLRDGRKISREATHGDVKSGADLSRHPYVQNAQVRAVFSLELVDSLLAVVTGADLVALRALFVSVTARACELGCRLFLLETS